MFRNRTVEVKFSKPKHEGPEPEVHTDINEVIATAATAIIFIIGAYMASDTIRQTAIHLATTKIK